MAANLIRVREKFQLTIPVGARRKLALQEGDFLEARVTDEGMVLRPHRLHGAAPAPRTASILDFLREQRTHGTRSREAIDAALAAERDAWDAKRP